MKVIEHQAWRRPILAHAEETYDLVAGEPKRAIMWYIHGEHQEEDQKRLGQVFFNKLHKERPAIAAHIQGTMFDPFHQDHIHFKIRETVRDMWYEENNKD